MTKPPSPRSLSIKLIAAKYVVEVAFLVLVLVRAGYDAVISPPHLFLFPGSGMAWYGISSLIPPLVGYRLVMAQSMIVFFLGWIAVAVWQRSPLGRWCAIGFECWTLVSYLLLLRGLTSLLYASPMLPAVLVSILILVFLFRHKSLFITPTAPSKP